VFISTNYNTLIKYHEDIIVVSEIQTFFSTFLLSFFFLPIFANGYIEYYRTAKLN
jgi:hypothetical protein